MAKHAKRRKKPTARRRRRIGAMALSPSSPSSPLVKFGSIAAGFFLGPQINAAIDKVTGTNIDSKIVAGGQVGLGYMLALRSGGKKSLVTTVLGGIMLGAGAKRGLTAFGVAGIGGYQMVPAVGGYQSVPSVGYGNRKRVGAYIPGPGAINGYRTTKEAVGSTGLSNAGSSLMQS